MTTSTTTYRQQVLTELDTVPDEYLPFVLQMLRSFHDNVLLKPAGESFRQSWQEAQCGQTYPVSTLWDGVAETRNETMADFFVGYAGTVNSREIHPEGVHLSQDTGRKFKKLMLKKHRKGTDL